VSEDRTFAPTLRRRQEARQLGHTARSAGLTSAVVLLVAALSAAWLGGDVVLSTAKWLRSSLSTSPAATMDSAATVTSLRASALTAVSLAAGFVLAAFAAALAGDVAQQGLLVAWPRITPDVRRVNPAHGWERLLAGLHPAVVLGEVVRWLLTCAALVGIAVAQWPAIASLTSATPPALLEQTDGIFESAALRLGGALLLLGIAHAGWSRWRYELSLRMTWEEHREEQRHAGSRRTPQPLRPVTTATVTRDAG
jgi:flagellar biosynthetic protein FlhB